MNRIKSSLFTLATLLIAGSSLYAQSVDEGRKFHYYQRYKSAKAQFEKALADKPDNVEAAYWLGQTLIEDKDSLAALAVYQKSLAANANAPLLLVGMGEIELMQGKTNDARQRFETAISMSKGKDIAVFNAIGKANAYAKLGDANYGIEKLNLATQVKKFNDANTYLYLGDAYRKLVDGGGAVTNYNKAFELDPKLAAAQHRIGKIYLTQSNKESFLPAFEKAVEVDPAYAPALYDLYTYWFNRDINKAAEYFDKYLAVADQVPSNEYDRISIIYARRMFPEAIAAAQQKISADPNADPRYYKLIAYSYDEQKDSLNAKNYLDQYFAKQKPDGFVPKDYVFRAQLLSKFPGNEAEALANFETAVNVDTAYESKLQLMTDAAAFAKKIKNPVEESNWLGKAYALKKEPVNVDLYNWGYANYQAGNYAKSDSIFCQAYQTKYPTEIYGYLWCARSAGAQDTTSENGTAVEPYKKLIAFADTARDKYKATLLSAHSYLAAYYANVAKQKDSAISHLESVLELDPENADAKKYITVLKQPAKPAKPASKSPAASTTRPATKPASKSK
ncbi:MAG: tetratricopeptide repeat protein [Chitinophagaceae bacterium]|nr:tetratricopeptide repeat protein [Chitinophagaceae bacterium]